MTQKQISVVITDMDNTLYNWVDMWYQSFQPMLNCLAAMSGIEQSKLETDIRSVFQTHGTSEYTFLIEEIPSLKLLYPNGDLLKRFSKCIDVYNKGRIHASILYPGVKNTLIKLREIGCIIIAYTESRDFYSRRRVVELGLDGLIDYLYSPPKHSVPEGLTKDKLRDYGLVSSYELQYTKQVFTAEGELKPNPRILREIINSVGASVEQTLYIGDSLMKDIPMAQDAGVTDVWAKYGEAQNSEAYALLRRVSHWKDEDVERERIIYQRRDVHPTYTFSHSFDELMSDDLKQHLRFVPYRAYHKTGQAVDEPTAQQSVRH